MVNEGRMDETSRNIWAQVVMDEAIVFECKVKFTIPLVWVEMLPPMPVMSMVKCFRGSLHSWMKFSETKVSSDPGSISRRTGWLLAPLMTVAIAVARRVLVEMWWCSTMVPGSYAWDPGVDDVLDDELGLLDFVVDLSQSMEWCMPSSGGSACKVFCCGKSWYCACPGICGIISSMWRGVYTP